MTGPVGPPDIPQPPPQPYVPPFPQQSTPRGLYNSQAQVLRLLPQLQPDGTMSLTWNLVSAVIDPFVSEPGKMMCRIVLGFIRRGIDQPMPLVAGRAPDRIGVLYFDLTTDVNGLPLVLAGDRVKLIGGSVLGTFEIRVIPDVAQDFLGAHHVECQVIEVSQALQPGTPQPFPGSAP